MPSQSFIPLLTSTLHAIKFFLQLAQYINALKISKTRLLAPLTLAG